jgi:hypothetical protein
VWFDLKENLGLDQRLAAFSTKGCIFSETILNTKQQPSQAETRAGLRESSHPALICTSYNTFLYTQTKGQGIYEPGVDAPG